jgi:hypothetical protein
MNENLPPLPPVPSNNPQPQRNDASRSKAILLGCGLALLIGIGLVALFCTVVCSGLNNMH